MAMRKARMMSAIAIAGAFVAMASAPAMADMDGSCNTGDICVYQHGNWVGSKLDTPYDLWNYSGRYYVGSSVPLNDSVSSMNNFGRSWGITFYTDANYRGSWHWIPEWSKYNAAFNDAYSSHSWDGS